MPFLYFYFIFYFEIFLTKMLIKFKTAKHKRLPTKNYKLPYQHRHKYKQNNTYITHSLTDKSIYNITTHKHPQILFTSFYQKIKNTQSQSLRSHSLNKQKYLWRINLIYLIFFFLQLWKRGS